MKLKIAVLILITNLSHAHLNHEERRALYKESTLKSKYVMLGDSITEHADWQSLLSTNDVANRGIGADSSKKILDRVDVIIKMNPKKVFLMMGINDMGQHIPPKQSIENYITIINKLEDANIEPIIISTLQCNVLLPRCDERSAHATEMNRYLKEYAQNHEIKFYDLDSILSNEDGLIMTYSNDGMHLNLNGYREWIKLIQHEFY